MLIFQAKIGMRGTYCIKHHSDEINETVWTDDVPFESFCNEDGYVMVQVRWNVCQAMDKRNFDEFVEEGW